MCRPVHCQHHLKTQLLPVGGQKADFGGGQEIEGGGGGGTTGSSRGRGRGRYGTGRGGDGHGTIPEETIDDLESRRVTRRAAEQRDRDNEGTPHGTTEWAIVGDGEKRS